MNKKLYWIGLLLFAYTSLASQSSSTFIALNQFLNTDFFKEYDQIRIKAEKAVHDFKIIQNQYGPDDIAAVRDAYNSSAEMFNAALYNIKNDLLDKQKRKYLVQYPADYSKQIEADLYRAKDYYANTFQREVAHVTDGEITGSALLVLLPELISYAKLAMDIVKKIQVEIKKFNEGMLNKHLIEAYKFKSWEEIE